MAKPPAGSSLLFGALADSGRIKQRKNGSYRMVLKGVDEIDWFTDRPDRVAGEWSPKKLVRKWDNLFGDVEPNAQATFEVGSKRELVTFEMFKPKLSDSNQTLSFKVRGIGEKSKDLLTGLRNKQLSDASLFIDDSLPPCLPDCSQIDLSGKDLSFAYLANVDMEKALLINTNLYGANLWGANLTQADLTNANLFGAYMVNANLPVSLLYGAKLQKANLTGADLNSAWLTAAHLTGADLTNANLSYSTLRGVDLTDANLTGANLSYADLSGANLTNANLTDVIWDSTICPDDSQSGNSPCTAAQLNLA